MTADDLEHLYAAVQALERPSLAARLSEFSGRPVELMRQALPPGAAKLITVATGRALDLAVKVALRSLRNTPEPASPRLHKSLAAGAGAIGGSFGLLALPFELPVSTVIMLRSILDIARDAGEDLRNPEAALACVQVFALGGQSNEISETGYLAARAVLAKSLAEAARFIAERGLVVEASPVLLRFVTQIASRFGVVVTQKLAAQALPVLGALGGASLNYAFIHHFQTVARGHFTVRRLERKYGKEVVESEYGRILADPAFPLQRRYWPQAQRLAKNYTA